MTVVKNVGPMVLAEEDGKFFLIREGKEQSQDFGSEKEAWQALRSRKVRWHDR